MEIVSFAQFGYEGETIKVEVDLRRGIPAIDIVGLADSAVREARERMRAAIRNSGFEFPRERILINLSPAGLKKEGSGFDLSIALAVLLAAGEVSAERVPDARIMALGELELSGTVRPVRGVLSAVSRGLETGITRYIVPEANRAEAEIRGEARVMGVSSLAEAARRFGELLEKREDRGTGAGGARGPGGNVPIAEAERLARDRGRVEVRWPDFSDGTGGYEEVRGQDRLIRALEIAAAGGHHLIAYGPPGCGKTLSLRRFPSILPELDDETAVTVTRIHSIAGISPIDPARSGASGLGNRGDRDDRGNRGESTGSAMDSAPIRSESDRIAAKPGLFRRPPFREPHPNASLEGMTGGGPRCQPGEISLAHGGVLFLDEAAQFRASVLQALRTPLETGRVTISRAGRIDTFPARFQLLMAVNPCPCGNFGAPGRICTCAPEMVERYWKRITAPLLDRIDLRVDLLAPSASDLASPPRFTTGALREAIGRARTIQRERNGSGSWGGESDSWLNARLNPESIEEICRMNGDARRAFGRIAEEARLSGRGAHGILKTARTIADLSASETIEEAHLAEAASFRRWKGAVPDFLHE